MLFSIVRRTQRIYSKGLAWNRKSVRIRNMNADVESLLTLAEKIANQLLVAVQRVRGGSEKVAAPAKALKQYARGVCLACDGENQPENSGLRRGQCDNCYPKTLRRLRTGKLKETTLILAGKLLPAGVGGRRDSDFPLDDLAKDKATTKKLIKNSKGKTSIQSNVQQKGEKTATANS